LTAFDKAGNDITPTMFAPSGFMRVDADYTVKPTRSGAAATGPRPMSPRATPNVFAVGSAFAPPHPISRPRKSPNGTVIAPSPPRTGMPSGVMGRTVARTIADRIRKGPQAPAYEASMAHMGAACVASAGAGLWRGSAAAMTMMPVVPDYGRFPTGQDLGDTPRRDRSRRSLGQADAPPPVYLQGQGPPWLATHPGMSDVTNPSDPSR
jgi:sulfide:quinone oxidoreductase